MGKVPEVANEAIPEDERQPTRRGVAESTRTFDQTFLRATDQTVHRDIASHASRWAFVTQQLPHAQALWVSGLVDGEGCFSFHLQKGQYPTWCFSIGLRADDQQALERVREVLGVGSFQEKPGSGNSKPFISLSVTSRADIREVVDFFRSYPLHGKKANDFYWWATAFDYYIERYKIDGSNTISQADLLQFEQFDAWIKEGREYRDADDELTQDPPGQRYLRHFLKYGINKKPFIVHEETDVLDVGCGPDRPLLLALFGGIGPHPLARSYTGVDLNRVKGTKHARSKIYSETNFFEEWANILAERAPSGFGLITNFEVIEHMPKKQGYMLLKTFYECLGQGGRLLLSTPVYDGKARAKNHIHEYTIPELKEHIEDAGLEVVDRFGTFANILDIKKVCTPEERELVKRLGAYYGNDVLSTFLAPLYPDASRNNLWVCKAAGDA